MKILCVEDDENLGTLLKTTLVNQHYQVEVATDGQTAWDLAETFTYDLILLDLILPQLDGIQFCRRLRSSQSSTLTALNRETPRFANDGCGYHHQQSHGAGCGSRRLRDQASGFG